MLGIILQSNPLYRQWDLASKLSAVAVSLIALLWWLVRKDHSAVKSSGLEIKQAITTLFMEVVINEARKLLTLVDEHLPIALSQESVANPERSRFDHFCESLRKISEEELNRGKYSAIIRDAFSGVIVQSLSRIMDAAESNSRASGAGLYNPTGLRFEMEGELHLKFAFVSWASALALNQRRRYYRRHHTALVAILLAVVCIFLLWFPIFVDAPWAWYICLLTLFGAAISTVVGLVMVVMSYSCQEWLQRKAQSYKEKSGLLNEFSGWTKDHSG